MNRFNRAEINHSPLYRTENVGAQNGQSSALTCLASNWDWIGEVGVQWHGRVQRLESCEQDDQDEDKVEIKTNSDFQSKSYFQKKLF